MTRIFLLVICIAIISCSKKSIPGKTVETRKNGVVVTDSVAVSNERKADSIAVSGEIKADSVTAPSFMVVSDGFGKIITSQKNLPPDANVKFDYLQLSKGFTPQQQANLKARYKTIPPRVLYISPQYQLSSARGAYYIYRKKFWYWKGKDGLFYLDTKYYL